MFYVTLSNEELHRETIAAAGSEKSATLVLLEFLHEVDRRRLYAQRGYSSLWEYVHKELRYSEAQTSERVGAMRLMMRVPEVKQCLERGELSLTVAAKLSSFVKKEKLPTKKVIELLHRIKCQSKREVEKILFAEQAVPSARPDVVHRTGVESNRISFDADEEFMEMLTRLKELQADPTLSLQALLKKTMKEYVAKREVKVGRESKAHGAHDEKTQRTASRPAEVKASKGSMPSRYIPKTIKNSVRLRAGDQCEYIARSIDPDTKQTMIKRCECRAQLQFDHRLPFALGGEHTEENIRLLCREHNLYVAEKVFGSEKVRRRRKASYLQP